MCVCVCDANKSRVRNFITAYIKTIHRYCVCIYNKTQMANFILFVTKETVGFLSTTGKYCKTKLYTVSDNIVQRVQTVEGMGR